MPTEPNLDKQVFTTFEVARICNANITSIKNWIDKGNLRAFRTPGGHFRIEKAVLVDFLERFGMPSPFAETEERSVVVLCEDPGTVELVRRAIGRNHEVHGTDDPIEAALLLGHARPDCFVIDMELNGVDATKMVERIRAHNGLARTWIVAWRGDTPGVTATHGADKYISAAQGIDVLTVCVRDGIQ
jgi:excisionase family DNA binding protein